MRVCSSESPMGRKLACLVIDDTHYVVRHLVVAGKHAEKFLFL